MAANMSAARVHSSRGCSTSSPVVPPRLHPARPLSAACGVVQSLRHMCARQVPSAAAAGGAAQQSTTAAPSAGEAAAALTYTSYEGNSFRLEFGATGVRLLVDPWLVDKLTFGGQAWLYAGTKRVATPQAVDLQRLAAETDAILLTMSIDDHAHRPTLRALPKSLPVVGSPSAAAVARELGFTTVLELDHGQQLSLAGGRLTLRGTAGALVGPPWSKRELGFVIQENAPEGISLYYEPHCDYVPESVAAVGSVDVVVSPPSSQLLLGYALVKGETDTLQLMKMLKPKVLIPLMNAEFAQQGPLAALLQERGGPAAVARQLAATPELAGVRVEVPKACQPLAVRL